MSEIKCVIFDWGGVLIDNPVKDFTEECSKVIGIEVEQLKSAYAEFAYQFEKGLIEENDLWKNIGKILNITINSANSIWYDCFKKIYSPREDIFNLASALKKNGCLVALLSNTEVPAMNFFLDQHYEMFDYKVFSCKEGEAKPEPELYRVLLNKLVLPAEQTLFIDDKVENIETARNLNMNAVQYVDKEKLMRNLHKYNINL